MAIPFKNPVPHQKVFHPFHIHDVDPDAYDHRSPRLPVREQRLPAMDQVGHLAYRLPQAHEYRPRDDAVPDVELLDLRKGQDRDDVSEVESVPGKDPETDIAAVRCSGTDFPELPFGSSSLEGVAVFARVDLDGVCPRVFRRAHLGKVRVDEKTHEYPRLLQP